MKKELIDKFNSPLIGHILAFFTVFLWGSTFISTKILLRSYNPVEILLFRFILALILLLIIYPKKLPKTNFKQEFILAMAGLSGICLYYLFENIALCYSLASNVGVITSIAPFFTAIIAYFFMKNQEKFSKYFMIGFVVAILGIGFISFNGMNLKLNPLGDFLALLASIVWAIYSILMKIVSKWGYRTILTTRKTFFYGILFMLPVLFFNEVRFDIERFVAPINLFNFLFLGVGASAICFVTWNKAVKILGAVKTSVYIYLIPVITVIASSIVLNEQITFFIIMGVILTLLGLIISNLKKDN